MDEEVNSDSNNWVIENRANGLEINDDSEVEESHRDKLRQVTSFVNAAYKTVEQDQQLGHPSPLIDDDIIADIGSPIADRSSSWTFGNLNSTRYSASSEVSRGLGIGLLHASHSGSGSVEGVDGGYSGDTYNHLLNLPSTLDSALAINQALQKKFGHILHRLHQALVDNKIRQEEINELLSEHSRGQEMDKEQRESSRYFLRVTSFCVPYFKDKSGRQPPKCQTAKYKVEVGYLDLYTTRTRPWLTSEGETLVRVVQEIWYKQLKEEWTKELKEAECKLRILQQKEDLSSSDESYSKKKDDLQKAISNCNNELNYLGQLTPDFLLIPKEAPIDWIHVAALAFDGHRTSEECELMWENLKRPTLNQKPWSEKEDITVQQSVLKDRSHKPKWDKIAEELGTKRSSYQVFQRWVSFIQPALEPMKWTPEATEKLINTINLLKNGQNIPWAQVQQHLLGFSRLQLMSRWRQVNPDQARGSFTVEDDYIFIKGLHKFGLNFDLIGHFMAGRNKGQIRQRFKRSLLPGFVYHPWTFCEDDKIVKECRLGKRNWRKLALVMNKRSPCQIRLRYHTLNVWQKMSESNRMPPPLFPLSMSLDPVEVHTLRLELAKERPTLATLFQISNNKIMLPIETEAKQLEKRRIAMRARRAESCMELLEKVTEKRGRRPGASITVVPAWPDIELTTFFLPSRGPITPVNFIGDKVMKNLKIVAKYLQLRITQPVSMSELKILKSLQLDEDDIKAANLLRINHCHPSDVKLFDEKCEACVVVRGDCLPAIPPNNTSIASLRSLLLHRVKLQEMASRTFLPYQLTKSELMRLGNKPRVVRRGKIKAEALENEVSSSSTKESDIPVSKIHITASKPYSKYSKYLPSANMRRYSCQYKQDNENHNIIDVLGKKPKDSTSSFVHINHAAVPPKLPTTLTNSSDGDDMDAKIKSDNLLFQRFLSIFFWPALSTMTRPLPVKTTRASERLPKDDAPIKWRWNRSSTTEKVQTKWSGVLPDLDIMDQYKALKKLEEVRDVKKYKNGNELCEVKVELPPKKKYKKNPHRKSNKPAQFKLTDIQNDDLTQPDVLDDDKLSSILSNKKRTAASKKNIVNLKRSIVMKTVWHNRRKGTLVERSTSRDKRKYIPRASRTRNCVVGSKLDDSSDKPWNVPMDGPVNIKEPVDQFYDHKDNDTNSPNKSSQGKRIVKKSTITNNPSAVSKQNKKATTNKTDKINDSSNDEVASVEDSVNEIVQPKETVTKATVQPKDTITKATMQPKETITKGTVQLKKTITKRTVQPKVTVVKGSVQANEAITKAILQMKETITEGKETETVVGSTKKRKRNTAFEVSKTRTKRGKK